MYEYRALVTNVVDGDTIDVRADLGFDVCFNVRLRLFGIDTPEVRTRDLEEKERGLIAKNYVESMCLGKEVTIHSKKDRQGKYGRYLAEVFVDTEVLSINSLLLKNGMAEVYR